jgi:hypothetical protein
LVPNASHPGVVAQHVQRLAPLQKSVRARSDRFQVAEVERQELEPVVARL